VRTAAVILVTAGLAASLAACGTTGTSVSIGDCSAPAPGGASDSVTVTGDFNVAPTIDFAEPLTSERTERTVLIAGDTEGAIAGDSDLVTLRFTLFNATTGTQVAASDYTAPASDQFYMSSDNYLPGLVSTLQCSPVGSRVVGVIPPADGFGDAGSGDGSISADDSLVFVADIVEIGPGYATGADQAPTDGFPTVTLDDAHAPTVVIPDAEPPADLQIAVLKKGDGEVVADGATVTVQYYGINWNTATVFDQSWTGGGPTSFSTAGVVEGFAKGMIGQTVGSQVIVVIPPELGYGPSGGSPDAGIGADDTIVFVIDILATA
jgi:FKBP-type peptidyl-prolyl cis-trans isomerase